MIMSGGHDDGSSTGLASGEIGSSSSFRLLQNYVNSLSKNSESTSTCQLVSSDTEDRSEKHTCNVTITNINTIVFRPSMVSYPDSDETDNLYAVAIVPSSDKVDVRRFSEELSKLQRQNDDDGRKEEEKNFRNNLWELAPSHTVRNLCGFEPGTIPPLLVPPRKDGVAGHELEGLQKRPFATIIDSSLLWRNSSITGSRSNNNSNDSEDTHKRLLLGGGGSIDHRCLIDLEFLVNGVFEIENSDSCQSGTRNAKISSIIRFDGGMNVNGATMRATGTNNRDQNNNSNNNPSEKKPFFQIAPPSGSIGSLVPEGSGKPHRPVPITAIGRLTSVRQIAKKLVFADFAPPDYNYNEWLANKQHDPLSSTMPTSRQPKNYDKTKTGMPGPPWRSGEDDKDMYVQIIVGKTFCERYEDGTDRLKHLRPGKLVLVRGAANVDPMQKNGWRNSAGNWAQKRSLDVIVSSFEILDEDESDDSLHMLVEEAQKEVASRGSNNGNWNNLLPWERKNDYERRAVAGTTATNGNEVDVSGSLPSSNNDLDDSTNTLTLDRFNSNLRDDPLDIKVVDDDDSIRIMAEEVSELFSRIEKDNRTSNILDYVAGIDCEWRPTGAYAEALLGGPDDNPVALLQICLPAIGKVFLVDTHRTLRANLADTEAMTEIEAIFSGAIGAMFGSEKMIKAGYSVAIDFRRLAASFPHIPSFRNVRSVVELSTLAERLHPKAARPWLGSLQRLTKLVLGYNITKEQQCSNWEARPLTPSQIEYATLDCALPSRLLDEMAEGSGTARMREILPGVTKSWRFQTIDGSRKDAIRRLKAKRVVGNTFLISQSWLNRAPEPDPTSIPEEGGGPYTDTDGILKMPADSVSIGEKDAPWKFMSGKTVIGGKKSDCIDILVGDSISEDSILDYNPRSGFIAFQDGLALFVNMPDPIRPSRRRMPYPNEWLEDGRFLTWYIRKNDWDDGNSEVAKLLSGSNDDDDSKPAPSSVVLFTRIGVGDFVCCGSCTASVADDNPSSAKSNKKLVKLNLRLNDWEMMKDMAAFSQMLADGKPRKNPRHRKDPVSFQKDLAQAVVDGNIVGALGMALDASHVSPTERSIGYGKQCLNTMLLSSDDPLSLQAREIIDNITV